MASLAAPHRSVGVQKKMRTGPLAGAEPAAGLPDFIRQIGRQPNRNGRKSL